jgi:hypothetical protein
MCRPSTRRALTALLALVFFAAVPAAARADCPALPLDRTFLPWLDAAWYEAAPDGGFEAGGAGWSLSGGAAVVDGNDPFLAGARSLSLPAGASAVTPPICVDPAHPTVRLFARGGSLTAPLAVSVVVGGREIAVGSVPASPAWAPSPVIPLLGNLVSGELSLRFASAGDWQLDDVYVDPYSKG